MVNDHQFREVHQSVNSQDIIEAGSDVAGGITEDERLCARMSMNIARAGGGLGRHGLPLSCRFKNCSGTQRGSTQVTASL